MTILPKNKSLSINNYEKDKKEVMFEVQSMLDTDLFFKMKEDELLSQIEKHEILNSQDDIVDDDLVDIKNTQQKSA